MSLSIRAHRAIWTDRIQFLAVDNGFDGLKAIGKPLILVEVCQDGAVSEPTFELSETEAQALMDQLWHCGIRPKEGSGSAGSLAATERHLKDLQRISMGLLVARNLIPSESKS